MFYFGFWFDPTTKALVYVDIGVEVDDGAGNVSTESWQSG